MVQDPREALHRDMPQSAIEHVTIDVMADSEALAGHIADDVRPDRHGTARPAAPTASPGESAVEASSGMSWPDCSGQLWEIDEAEPLRFRCRVGHGWTGESLVEGQE